MNTEKNVVYFADADKPQTGDAQAKRRAPLQELQDQFVGRVTDLFAAMLDNTDDALFALADKAENNRIQSMYFDSMREVRLKRGEMETRFRAELLDAFRGLRLPGAGAAASDEAGAAADWSSDELALVGHDDLEESLAVDGMVGKARSRNSHALAHLRARMAHLLPGVSLDEDSDPTDPKCLCSAFRRAAQALDLEVRAKLVVYKLFDKSVMEALGELYTQTNHLLINAGVLPHIKIRVPGARPAATLPHAHGAASAPWRDTGANVAVSGEGGEVFGTLQGLLADRRGVPAAGGGAGTVLNGAPSVYASDDVLHALNLLQTGHQLPLPECGTEVLGAADLRTALGGVLAQLPGVGAGKALGRTDEDIIDIVSMLFDFILDDAALPDRVRALLARLQIPMLKVAMLDRSFFSSRQHPARQLLNELAQGAAGAQTPAEHDLLYRHSAEAVDRILQEFEDDVAIFSGVLESYREAVRGAATSASDGEEPVATGDPVETARARARAAVDARLEGRTPPPAVAAMLRDAWAEVLTEIALDEGAAPAVWEHAAEVVDRVLWSIEPKMSYEERKRLIESIPGLLRELRQGLARISVPSRELSAYFQALQECHIECIKDPPAGAPTAVAWGPGPDAAAGAAHTGTAHPHAVVGEATPPRTDADLAADAPMAEDAAVAMQALPDAQHVVEADGQLGGDSDEVEEIVLGGEPEPEVGTVDGDDERVRRLRGVALGTWFEFADTDGTRTRAKLSARIERTGKFIFVNRAGFKIAEKTLPGLVVELRRGTTHIVDDGQLFDKALEAVISNLRSARA